MSSTGKFFLIMKCDLHEEPEVIEMAEMLKCREETIVGYLHRVWSWFTRKTNSDRIDGVSLQSLGRTLKLDGFPQLMEQVGWLREYRDDNGRPFLIIPNHDRWLSGKAARNAHERERMRQKRRENKGVAECSNIVRTNSEQIATTDTDTDTDTDTEYLNPENSRKTPPKKKPSQKNKPISYSQSFERFWSLFPKQGKSRKADAYKYWSRLDPSEHETIFSKVVDYALSDIVRKGYSMAAPNWLRDSCWEDDPESWKARDRNGDVNDQDDELPDLSVKGNRQ